jgi:hypothetical protein
MKKLLFFSLFLLSVSANSFAYTAHFWPKGGLETDLMEFFNSNTTMTVWFEYSPGVSIEFWESEVTFYSNPGYGLSAGYAGNSYKITASVSGEKEFYVSVSGSGETRFKVNGDWGDGADFTW